MKHLILALIFLLIPVVCFSQTEVNQQRDSIEAVFHSNSFKVEIRFDPAQINSDKGEYVHHVMRYTKRDDEIFSLYYRQQYMDGELEFVSKKKVDQFELTNLKDWILVAKKKSDSLDGLHYYWDVPRPIAIMYIQNREIKMGLALFNKDNPLIVDN